MKNIFTTLGIVCLLVGAAVLAGPVFGGFSTTADRESSVTVADTPQQGYLGLEDTYTGPVIEYSSGFGWVGDDTDVSAEVLQLTNNANEPLDIDIDVRGATWDGGGDSDVFDVANADVATGELASGGSVPVELECSQAINADRNDATVELSVEATGSSTAVDQQSFPVEGVDFDCEGDEDPEGGIPATDPVPITDPDIDLELVGTPTASDSSGTATGEASAVSFDIEQTGESAVTITEVGVSDTSSEATEIEYDGLFVDGDEVTIDASDGGHLDHDTSLEIDPDTPQYILDEAAVIESDDSATITIEQFRTGGLGSQVDIAGESVTVIMTVEGLDPDDPDTAVPVELEVVPEKA